MSNLIKARSIRYGADSRMVIDANQSLIMKDLERRIRGQLPDGPVNNEGGFVSGLKIHDYIKEDQILQEEKTETNLLEQAQEEAESLLEEARIQAGLLAQNAAEEAKQKGYQEGYQSGREAALEELRQQKEAQERSIQDAQQQLECQFDEYRNQITVQAASMITRLVAKLTGIVAKGQRSVILHLLNQALREAENSQSFLIRVSQEDYAYVEEHWEDIYGSNHPGIQLTLIADGKLAHNQCLIESESGLMDCSLNVQLEELTDCLKLLEGEET